MKLYTFYTHLLVCILSTYCHNTSQKSINNFRVNSSLQFINQSLLMQLIPIIASVSCNDPEAPSNGSQSGKEFKFGKTVSYKCDPGYKMTGIRNRTCTTSQTWTGSLPSSTRKHCKIFMMILKLLK